MTCKLETPSSETIDAVKTECAVTVDIGHLPLRASADVKGCAFAFVAATADEARNTREKPPWHKSRALLVWGYLTKVEVVSGSNIGPWCRLGSQIGSVD